MLEVCRGKMSWKGDLGDVDSLGAWEAIWGVPGCFYTLDRRQNDRSWRSWAPYRDRSAFCSMVPSGGP